VPHEHILREPLAQAEEHIAQGEAHLSKQRRIIADLEEHGHDTKRARDFLKELEQVQELHLADKERVARELEREIKRE